MMCVPCCTTYVLSLSLSAEVVKRQRKGGNRQEIRGGIPSSVGDLNLH